jgi:hypothetical protein
MTDLSDYDSPDSENEPDDEYFTEDGLPKIDERFYSGFLEEILKKDPDVLLTEWVERLRSTRENPAILRHAVCIADYFPEEYRDRIVFAMLSQYELLRQRAAEIDQILEEEGENDESGDDEGEKFNFEKFSSSPN